MTRLRRPVVGLGDDSAIGREDDLRRLSRTPRGRRGPRREIRCRDRGEPDTIPRMDRDGVRERWQEPIATLLVLLATAVLVTLDLTDHAVRRWFEARAITADTLAGLLVLLITILIVNQVLRLRSVKERSRATAAQAAIVLAQARRSTDAVRGAIDDPSSREDATDEMRTCMTMLLIAAPVLIDARLERAFLERAQKVGLELVRCVGSMTRQPDTRAEDAALTAAIDDLRAAARPLLASLSHEQLFAVSTDEDRAGAVTAEVP